MASSKKMLVLAVDIDDDLGQKAKVKGPVVGRKETERAATMLATADPEETDANTMFGAIKEYDALSKEYDCQVATITGSQKLGFKAERELVEQLEKVLAKFPAQECVFVSDGASDEQILPIVQSRVKISGVRTITVKQTKELEQTYFVILEKLKDPHYARIIFGIPGIALLLYFLLPFAFPDVGPYILRLLLGLLGAYLIIKGFGIEEFLLRSVEFSRFSLENPSFIFQFASVSLIMVSVLVAVLSREIGGLKTILILLPISLLLFVLGNAIQAFYEKKSYQFPSYVNRGSAILLLWLVLDRAFEWVLGTIAFAEFFHALILSALAMLIVTQLSREFKGNIITQMKLEGREVYSEIGGFIGKIAGVQGEKDALIVQTPTSKIDFGFEQITRLGDKVIVRY